MNSKVETNPVEKFDVEPVNSPEKRELYASRKKFHPKRAKGTFRSLKWVIMIVTLSIYYFTPWIRWDRGPYAPDQAVLADMASRRFYFFSIEIWPQEFFYVAGLLVMAGIGLFLITSTAGRAWCGYACPQTVWVDLFLVVERFFEGDRAARIKLDAAPMSASKFAKRFAKHSVWLLISVATGGAWIFYFSNAPDLAKDVFTGQAPFTAYATVAILTATTYTFGGFMREQVCTYMCPWPRIQGAMLDENSLVVTYNDWRGEPRSRHAKRMKREGIATGDCVDCSACVVVCPMGIDIREGQQMECITCALCIDACNGVMEKLGVEKGLISYSTFSEYKSNTQLAATGVPAITKEELIAVPTYAHEDYKPENVRDKDGKLSDKIFHTSWRSVIRLRTLIYFGIYMAIGLAMLVTLLTRVRMDITAIPDRNPLFVQLSDGSIRNGYTLKIANMIPEKRKFRLTVDGLDGAQLMMLDDDKIKGDTTVIDMPPDQTKTVKIFVIMPQDKLKGQKTDYSLYIHDVGGEEHTSVETSFLGPKE